MTLGVDERHFDAVVIGAGQAGVPLAVALAQAGRRTAMIERRWVGGTCVNDGCTPTKTMVASARVAWQARGAGEYGVSVDGVRVDVARVRRRKQQVVESFRHRGERRLADAGVELIHGEAAFTGKRALSIATADGARAIRADLVFINTGARPAPLRVPGIDTIDVLDSTSVMELDRAPEHLLVIGGGYVGLEMAQAYRRFGSRVTVVQNGPRLLGREDPDIADAVAELLRGEEIDILLSSRPTRFGRDGGTVRATVETPDGERTVEATHVLAAAGRLPNTDTLNPSAGGVEVDERGFVHVDERLRTSAEGVYALGDVNGGPAFTHVSYDDYRIIRTNVLEGGSATTAGRVVPYVVYIDPQLGRVGLGETEARDAGREVRIARMPMAHVARAIETGDTRGMMKAVVDAATDQILGCAILGMEGGEMMTMVQLAMQGGLPYTALRDGIFAHPTLAEAFNNLFATLE